MGALGVVVLLSMYDVYDMRYIRYVLIMIYYSELHLYSVCDCIGHAASGRGLVLGIGHTTNKNIMNRKIAKSTE